MAAKKRKTPAHRNSHKATTIATVTRRLKRAIRLGKSENYIADLETKIKRITEKGRRR